MTEAEWLMSGKPWTMLDEIREIVTDRKLRLFLSACCRRVCGTTDCPRMVEVSEQFADSTLGIDVLLSAYQEAVQAHESLLRARTDPTAIGIAEAILGLRPDPNRAYVAAGTLLAVRSLATGGTEAGMRLPGGAPIPEPDSARLAAARDAETVELAAQSVLLCDIFGNPFRPVIADPSWLTSTVMALARGIYDERAFDRLPILADVLQDAGCEHADILAHCRGDGPHVRGCWVVDLVLGKT